MNGDRRTHVKRILEAIENGTLPPPETERRLCELIEHEVTRTDASPDEEFISACIALWDELHNQDSTDYEECAAQLRRRIDSTLCSLQKRQKRNRVLTKVVAAVAAIIILIVGISFPIRWIWFDSWSTPDEQQYVIMGHDISVEMVETALATHEGVSSVMVDDVSKLPEILGFDLGILEELGADWTTSYISIRYFPGFIRITVMYRHLIDPERSISCVVNCYTDIEYAYISFEQNREGERIDLSGFEMYVSENNEKASVCWYNNNIFLWLSGDVTPDDAAKLMYELIGGTHNE